MKTVPCIFAALCLLAANGYAQNRYETLKEHAAGPLQELRFEVESDDRVTVPDVELDLGTEFLALDALLNAVQRRNPSLESARNSWQAALAEFPQAKALDDPTISYSVAPRTLDRPSVGNGGDRIDQGHVIEISQAFPWPGKRRLRGEMALLEADGARADIETVRQGLNREAKLAYYEYWYVHRALEINMINVELLREFQTIAESQYASGRVSKQDALQAEVEREHLAHQGIVLNRLREVTRARMNMLLNRAPESALPPPPTNLPAPQASPNLNALLDEAFRNRPELHAIDSRIEARETGVDLARMEFRPDFKVMARYSSLWEVEARRFTIGVGLNIPIQLGKRRGALDEARAERAALEAGLARQASQVAMEVKEAYESLRENRHVVDLYDDRLIPAAEENLDAAQSGYAAGQVDFLALISAQKLLMDTRLTRYEALASYHQTTADLERAIGASLHPARP